MTAATAPAPLVPNAAELGASTRWQVVDVLSDLHLSEMDAATFMAWRRHMETTPAQAVLLLGDTFERWVGDDMAPQAGAIPNRHDGLSFEDRVARTMRFAAERLDLYLMHGNRDFLLGSDYLSLCRAQLLADPTVLIYGPKREQRILLTHGDLLCTDDLAYQQFRTQVRSPQWQADFLAKPLSERQALANQMRTQSQAQHAQRAAAVDVNAAVCEAWMRAERSATMLHGHTHTGSTHASPHGARWVTSDWHAELGRGDVLRIRCGADRLPQLQRISMFGQ